MEHESKGFSDWKRCMSLLAEGDYLQRSSSFSIYLLYLRNAIEIITNFCDILDFYAEVLSWIPGMSVLTKVLGSKLWPVSKPLFQWILLTLSAMSVITDDITEGGSAILGANLQFPPEVLSCIEGRSIVQEKNLNKNYNISQAFSKHFFLNMVLVGSHIVKMEPTMLNGKHNKCLLMPSVVFFVNPFDVCVKQYSSKVLLPCSVARPWWIMPKNEAFMLCSYASYYWPVSSGLGTVMLH